MIKEINTNKLTLNKNKKFHNIYTKREEYNTENADITLNGNIIEQVMFTKWLGVYIDELLSWTIHINNLFKKLNPRNVGMLHRLKHALLLYTIKTLYYSLLLSNMQYCVLLWSNTHTNH